MMLSRTSFEGVRITEPRTDADLLRAAHADPQAFREFYERYAVWIRAWFQRHTGSDSVALDLTAETFAQAWHSLRRYRDLADGSGAPWLFGIARNLLRQYHKHNRIESAARLRLGLPAAFDGGAPPPGGSPCGSPSRGRRTASAWTSGGRPPRWPPRSPWRSTACRRTSA